MIEIEKIIVTIMEVVAVFVVVVMVGVVVVVTVVKVDVTIDFIFYFTPFYISNAGIKLIKKYIIIIS